MAIKGQTSRRIRYAHIPKDGPSIVISPNAIIAHNGVIQSTIIYVDVFDGDERVPNTSVGYSPLFSGTASGSTDAATGLTWAYASSTSTKRAGYRVSAADLKKDFVASTTVTYKGVDYPVSIPFTRVDDGQDGKSTNGVDGKNGVWVPPPMLWDDYPTGYVFQSGNLTKTPMDTRLDIVLVRESTGKLTPYRCVIGHTKSKLHDPATDNSSKKTMGYYWQACDAGVYKFLATELLLAYNARIDFLSGQSIRVGEGSEMCGYFGSPVSGAIFYSGGDNIANATFVVYADGSLRCGNAQGKRIVLNPATQSLEAYGADGLPCYTLSGEDIDVNNPIPSGQSKDFTGSALSATLPMRAQDAISNDDYMRSETYTLLSIAASNITKQGTVKVSIPQLTLNPAFYDGGTYITSVMVEYVLMVGGAYAGSHFAELTRDYTIGTTPVTTNRGSTAAFALSASVSPGDTVVLEAKVTASFYGTYQGEPSAKATASAAVTAHLSFGGMLTRFGRNGVVISLDSDNYFYVLFGGGQLRVDCKSAGKRVFKSENVT